MYNALIRNNLKFVLIGKISGLASEVKRARKALKKSAKNKSIEAVWRYQFRKAIIGTEARHHLLAYGFLRGVPYHTLEQKCHAKPNSLLVLQIIQIHAPKYMYLYNDKMQVIGSRSFEINQEQVEQWLNGENVQCYDVKPFNIKS